MLLWWFFFHPNRPQAPPTDNGADEEEPVWIRRERERANTPAEIPSRPLLRGQWTTGNMGLGLQFEVSHILVCLRNII